MKTDEELMLEYARGDEGALDELHRRYRSMIHAAMSRCCGGRVDPDDVVQQTFLRLHIARGTYRAGEPVRPWLMTIAHNVRKDAARAAARRPEASFDADAMPAQDDPAQPLERAQSVSLLRRALAHLTPALRTTVEMHWLEERDFEEVSRISGVRQGTIRVRAHRACVQLRSILHADLETA